MQTIYIFLMEQYPNLSLHDCFAFRIHTACGWVTIKIATFRFKKKKWLTLISFASIEFSSFSFSFSSKIWPHRTTWFSDSTSDSILNEKVRILLKLYWIWFSHCGDYELPAYGQTMESQLIIFRLADAFTFLTFECVVCIAINEQNDQSKIEKDSRRATFFIG